MMEQKTQKIKLFDRTVPHTFSLKIKVQITIVFMADSVAGTCTHPYKGSGGGGLNYEFLLKLKIVDCSNARAFRLKMVR